MADHYYSKTPQSKSEQRTIETWIFGETARFVTDDGVFSKSDIDFGSKLLIETIYTETKSTNVDAQKWLDLGCGYGAIGVSLLRKFPNVQLTMLDINERAIACAKQNVRAYANQATRVMQSDGLQAVASETFDRIITNPPIRAGKQMIHQWYEQAFERLNEGGHLWLVIQKKQGAPSTFEKLQIIYRQTEEITREKGYSIFRAIK